MLNTITIMGRLTRDPELRHTQSGTAVASFTIACDRDIKNKDTGERATDFIDCVAWRNTGEYVSRYFTKGRMAVVSGRLQMRDWTDKDGNKRRSAEIVAENVYFGDSKPEGGGGGYSSSYNNGQAAGGYTNSHQSGNTGGYRQESFGGYPNTSVGGYGAPPNSGEYGYLTDDDGELPF